MTDSNLLESRWAAISARLVKDGADALVLSTGFDLVYLSTYEARASERLTAFVGRPGSNELPRMIVPKIEMPEVPKTSAFDVSGWTDDQDPIAMIVELIGDARRVLVSDEMWAHYLLRLKAAMPDTEFVSLSDSLGGLRSVKSDSEMQALQTVGGLANSVAAQIQRGDVALVGRTELEIQADVIDRLLAAGHEQVEFCIVASGPNSASPHHNPTERVVQPNEIVLFDFGGKHEGYCSDITRCVFTGPVPSDVAATYATLKKAQQAAVDAARPGATLGDVDAAARSVIADAGFGDNFIHRTGHGIGTEVHEQPYVKAGNDEIVAVGHAFSIEPGIYLDGKWGIRLEDIVVILDDGALRCSTTDHDLVEVDA
ncbi:MAG: aminopeptidase P family protein [Acidimicrobiaceae bacterium]|jgi:Xaa-Pro aminopeptidase|nr:M24 family metallopeptidase [Acidimicrobiaceae bacterium]MCO4833161.1 aminopeptidase P family protein [Acidimicrobiaceae bacterium]MDB4205590.1 aminopeptidase P family protein [bacterium]